jgi:hypothetical protein
LRRPPATAPTVARPASNTAINPGMDALHHQGISRYRQRVETDATSKPTRSAGKPGCSWPGDNMKSGGSAAACTRAASFPGRSSKSPKSIDQDAASSYRWRASLESSHQMASQVGQGWKSYGDEAGAAGLALCGWLVELRLTEREADPRFFAVGMLEAGDAEEAMLRYPGIVRDDKRTALRALSDKEIACLGLRMDSVRPYIW